jgi:hypothetical protein
MLSVLMHDLFAHKRSIGYRVAAGRPPDLGRESPPRTLRSEQLHPSLTNQPFGCKLPLAILQIDELRVTRHRISGLPSPAVL